MTDVPHNYRKYLDDVTKMTQRGAISSREQINSPSSAGSRGLAKLDQFTNNKTQMQLGQEAIAESMVDIRNIMNRIDGVNVPANEMNELADNDKIEFTKLLLDMSVIKDRVQALSVDEDAKASAIQSLTNAEEALVALDETADYEPFPEGDEFDIEEDEDFEEVLGPLGFPEDETELFDAEYQGRKVPLNKPMRGDVKKFKVYVKDPKTGNVKKVNFGHGGTSAKRPTMRIRKSNPKARKSFRARHNCANPGPKTKARYWSCRKW
jgi:hypothetical protein